MIERVKALSTCSGPAIIMSRSFDIRFLVHGVGHERHLYPVLVLVLAASGNVA